MTVRYPGAMSAEQMKAMLDAKRNGTAHQYKEITYEVLVKSVREFYEKNQPVCVPDIKFVGDRVIINGCGMHLNGSRELFENALKKRGGII